MKGFERTPGCGKGVHARRRGGDENRPRPGSGHVDGPGPGPGAGWVVTGTGVGAGSVQDLLLRPLELLVGDVAAGADVGELGELVRLAGAAGGLTDVVVGRLPSRLGVLLLALAHRGAAGDEIDEDAEE